MSNQVELLNERIYVMERANDSNIDGIMIFDTALRTIYWNKTCETITGIARNDALGKHADELFPEFSESKDIQTAINHTLKGRKTFVPYEKCPRKDCYYELHFVPLLDEGGSVSGIQGVAHDVAHRIKIERELKSLNKSLVKKNKELKQMNAELVSIAQVTSQELKEPLHKVYSFAELLKNKEMAVLSESGKMYVKRIQAAAQRMRLVTDDILAYSEINTQKRDLSVVDLNIALLHILKNIQSEIALKNASIHIGELGTYKGYRSMLLTLFQNLVRNALKYHKDGVQPEILIEAQQLSDADIIHPDVLPGTDYLRIGVTDNGMGFNQDEAETMFQMFQRGHQNVYASTGIGLAICKKIAELHNGFITADSRENEGSTFSVYLPVAKS